MKLCEGGTSQLLISHNEALPGQCLQTPHTSLLLRVQCLGNGDHALGKNNKYKCVQVGVATTYILLLCLVIDASICQSPSCIKKRSAKIFFSSGRDGECLLMKGMNCKSSCALTPTCNTPTWGRREGYLDPRISYKLVSHRVQQKGDHNLKKPTFLGSDHDFINMSMFETSDLVLFNGLRFRLRPILDT